MQDSAGAYVEQGWYTKDERAKRGRPKWQQNDVVLEQEITTAEERARLPFYQDFLRKYGLEWWAGAMCPGKDPWCVTFHRELGSDPFDSRNASEMAALAPDIAIRLKLLDQMERTSRRLTLDAWEFANVGAILIGSAGYVLGMTSRAEQLMSGALSCRNHRLVARHSDSNHRLQCLLARIAANRSSAFGAEPNRQAVRRENMPPLILEGLPLPFGVGGRYARAVLIVSDGSLPDTIDQNLLRQAFDISPAESRLAAMLLEGGTARDVAQRMGLSYQTVRNQLKSLFEKTGTARQSELVKLLAHFSR